MRLLCVLGALAIAPLPSPRTDVHHELVASEADPSKTIEYYWVAPQGKGPWPVVVLLHGHQDGIATPGGKAFVDYGVLDTLARRGYVGVAVSQPGYGHSSGPPDFMGPATVGAVDNVLRRFRMKAFVRADRIALEGVSRGAIVASLVAARDSTIRALVLISGAYDFVTALDSSTPAGRRNLARRAQVASDMAAETDGSAAALRARSALLQADRTDPDQARALAAAIQRNGLYARALIYPQFGHAIPYATRELEIAPFLRERLK
jgi:pimeloyl-ACP methyl ester carboxylesterase